MNTKNKVKLKGLAEESLAIKKRRIKLQSRLELVSSPERKIGRAPFKETHASQSMVKLSAGLSKIMSHVQKEMLHCP